MFIQSYFLCKFGVIFLENMNNEHINSHLHYVSKRTINTVVGHFCNVLCIRTALVPTENSVYIFEGLKIGKG